MADDVDTVEVQDDDKQDTELSEQQQAEAAAIRLPHYESLLREAHANPVAATDDDGNTTFPNIADITADYTAERERLYRERAA